MTKRPKHLPEFENPPVVEVVLAVQFSELVNFRTIHAGLLWQVFKTNFPGFSEQPPLDPVFETFGTQAGTQLTARISLGPRPPIARLWFVNESETELIQFQPDRFIHNWRKIGEKEEYPRYEKIKQNFLAELNALEKFLREEKIGEIQPNQCEVTYINHIPSQDGENLRSNLGKVFPFWNDNEVTSELGNLEDAQISARFVIASDKGQPIGRFHVKADPASGPDGTPMMVLNLTARGMPEQPTLEAASKFLDLGREKIVQGFALLTSAEMHRRWRRI